MHKIGRRRGGEITNKEKKGLIMRRIFLLVFARQFVVILPMMWQLYIVFFY